jgi:membrane protein
MWVYYASLILFFGAEFTQVYAKQTGTRVVPRKYAMPVTAEARAQEGIPHEEDLAPQLPPGPPQGKPVFQPVASLNTPGVVIRRRPWQFVGLMLFAGLAGGALLKFKSLRKAVRLYAALDKP